MKLGFFCDSQGDFSMGRLILFIVALAGAFVLVLGAFDLVWTMFYEVKHYTEPLGILGTGATMLVGSGGGKLLQNHIEVGKQFPVAMSSGDSSSNLGGGT